MSDLTRKQWNRAVAQEARKAGVYPAVMGDWATLDRTLTPEHVVLGYLDAGEPAKVTRTPKAPLREPDALEVKALVEAANQRARAADLGYGSCGGARVVVRVPGTSRLARALREAGFYRIYTGAYADYVCGAQNLDANEPAAEWLAGVLRDFGLDVSVSTYSN